MKSCKILAISASASAASKTARVVDFVLGRLDDPSLTASHIELKTIDPSTMLEYPASDVVLKGINETLAEADGVIIATPIYKASYSGLLKMYLDQLPQFAFAGKAVMPLATGGSLAHVLALDYALRPVLQSMGARHIVQSHFVVEGDIQQGEAGIAIRDEAAGPLLEAVHHFKCTIQGGSADKWLGHPRPLRSPASAAVHL